MVHRDFTAPAKDFSALTQCLFPVARRLSDVLKACAMDSDVSRMNGGDMAFIGEKGVNLSGGQRARLALAR